MCVTSLAPPAEADIRPFYENQLKWCGVDYEDPAVQSRKCLEVCRKFGKPVIIMEPVKGGNLVSPPGGTKKISRSASRRQRGMLCRAVCGRMPPDGIFPACK